MRRSLDAGVLTLGFDRPKVLNAVSAVDMQAMADAVERAGSDPTIRVVVLVGEGRAFCSGADVGTGSKVAEDAAATIDAAERLVRAVASTPRPVIARARGVVAGVGVSIALACDLVLCDEDSYLMLAFTRVGLMPDGGATALVAASVGRARAMRMAMTAEKLNAGDALQAGLVTHVWPVADFDKKAERLVESLARGPAVALGRTKLAINDATLPALPAALATERSGQLALLGAADFREGSNAFAERRSPTFSDAPALQLAPSLLPQGVPNATS